MGEEWSLGGSRIYRHEAREGEPEISGGDVDLIEALDGHIARFFPDVEDDVMVFHEVVSPVVHVDVNLVPPGERRPWVTLVTSGMAERPMNVPEGLEDHRHAELVLALPPDWPLEQEQLDDDRNFWPIRLLKQLARLPHEYETFLYHGHTVPNGDPPEPYAPDTELCCALIVPPISMPPGFDRVEVGDGRVVHLFAVVPLTEDEMELKLRKGADELLDLFDEHGVSEVLDPARASVVARKRGLFRR